MLAVIELPSRAQRIQFVLRTIKGWGVNTDDPEVFSRVYMSFMEADEDRERRREIYGDDREDW